MKRRTYLDGGPCNGGPLDGCKRMAYGGPVMPAIDTTGKRVGSYVWDGETGYWEFDSDASGDMVLLYDWNGDDDGN